MAVAVGVPRQLVVTAYLAHLVVGQRFVWEWIDRSKPTIPAQMTVALAILAAAQRPATAWRSRFKRGPVEAVVRVVSG